jgi:hypothetical protein
LHCASVLHATHWPLGTSHTEAEHSLSLVQPRHVWLVGSQMGVDAFLQSVFSTHATHVYVASSQTGVAPVHAASYFEVHVTH